MKIVCDTNVLVSGVLFGGHCRRILSVAAQGHVTIATSPALLRKVEDVLLRAKFGLRRRQVSKVVALFQDTLELVHPTSRINAITADPADNVVLEAAVAASAGVIVSGDKHLLGLKEWSGSRVLSPAEVVKEGMLSLPRE